MKSLIAAAQTIDFISAPALRTLLASSRPGTIKLTGLVPHWSAVKWSTSDGLNQLRSAVGEETAVEVELGQKGRGYLDDRWQRVTMGFGLFLDAFVLGKIPSSSSASLPIGYLAQSDLIDSHPGLSAAAPALPHFQSGPKATLYRRTLWVGPGGTFTPFHRDPYTGLFSQVVGKKVFYCLPPEASEFLTISRRPLHNNTSEIPFPVSTILPPSSAPTTPTSPDPNPDPSIERYRDLLAKAFALPGACEVRLDPGDSVLVPEGWWHSAEGLDESASVGIGAWFR